MSPYLLDVNVLIALAWPNHVHHGEALRWFETKTAKGFRTCPMTQAGFVRISSNASFVPNPPGPLAAMALLMRITELPGHGFWPDDLPLSEAFGPAPLLVTHRHVTDGYLLALAAAHGGVLATLDRGIASLARQCPDRLEVILSNRL
jgi:toxin-antitoxin system PIN domain toxin